MDATEQEKIKENESTKLDSGATKLSHIIGFNADEKTSIKKEPEDKKKKAVTFDNQVEIIYVENYKQYNKGYDKDLSPKGAKRGRINCECIII